MPAAVALTFGPFAFEVDSPVFSPLLEPFRSEGEDPIRVVVSITESAVGAERATMQRDRGALQIEGPFFGAAVDAKRSTVRIQLHSRAPRVGLLAALGALVAWRAPEARLAVLHAGAVTIADGVAALLAPSGGGKSTAVLESPGRPFAFNGVLVRPEDATCWPLPFTGGDDPPLEQASLGRLTTAVLLEKSSEASVEPLDAREATNALIGSLFLLSGDPRSAEVVAGIVGLAPSLRRLRVRRPRGASIADLVDSSSERNTVTP